METKLPPLTAPKQCLLSQSWASVPLLLVWAGGQAEGLRTWQIYFWVTSFPQFWDTAVWLGVAFRGQDHQAQTLRINRVQ